MDFKQRLKRALDASDLNYGQVAEKLGVNPSRISEWLRDPEEAGASLPNAENLLRLPAILGVSGHWLLTGEGDMVARPGRADEILEQIRALVSPRSSALPGDLDGQWPDADPDDGEGGNADEETG